MNCTELQKLHDIWYIVKCWCSSCSNTIGTNNYSNEFRWTSHILFFLSSVLILARAKTAFNDKALSNLSLYVYVLLMKTNFFAYLATDDQDLFSVGKRITFHRSSIDISIRSWARTSVCGVIFSSTRNGSDFCVKKY